MGFSSLIKKAFLNQQSTENVNIPTLQVFSTLV